MKSTLSVELLERMADMLRLLAHPQRLRVIEYLEYHREAPVFKIVQQVGLPQAATSQHLNQMRRAGLIASERRGKEVWYSIADPRALTILGCIRKKQGAAS